MPSRSVCQRTAAASSDRPPHAEPKTRRARQVRFADSVPSVVRLPQMIAGGYRRTQAREGALAPRVLYAVTETHAHGTRCRSRERG